MGNHYSSSNKTSQFLFIHHPFTHLLLKLEMRIGRLSSETTNLILFYVSGSPALPPGSWKRFQCCLWHQLTHQASPPLSSDLLIPTPLSFQWVQNPAAFDRVFYTEKCKYQNITCEKKQC